MKHIRPDSAEPLSAPPPARLKLGTVIIRFVLILVIAVAILAMIWMR